MLPVVGAWSDHRLGNRAFEGLKSVTKGCIHSGLVFEEVL